MGTEGLTPYFFGYTVPPLDDIYTTVCELLEEKHRIVPYSRQYYLHATIKTPMNLPPEEYRDLVQKVSTAAEGHVVHAERVRIGPEIRCFEDSGTLYLPVVDSEPVMHRWLTLFDEWGYPPRDSEGKPPHLTLASGVDSATIPLALESLRELPLPLGEPVEFNSTAFFVKDPSDGNLVWNIKRQIELPSIDTA